MNDNWKIINIEGMPPSVNSIYRRAPQGNFMYMTPIGKQYKTLVMHKAREQFPEGTEFTGRVFVHVELYTKQKRRSDIDNRLKVLIDGLNKIAFTDDSQIDDLRIIRRYSPDYDDTVKIIIGEMKPY